MTNHARGRSVSIRIERTSGSTSFISLATLANQWRTRRKACLAMAAMLICVPLILATSNPSGALLRPHAGERVVAVPNWRRHGPTPAPSTTTTRPRRTAPTTLPVLGSPTTTTPPTSTTTTTVLIFSPIVTTTTTTLVTTTTTSPASTTTTQPVRATTTTPPPPPTTAPVTTTTPAPAPGGDGSWWHPPTGALPWQWEIDHPLDLSSATDMGTNDTLPDGSAAPAPVVYDIDGIENSAATVSALHAKGDHVICYIEVGTAGNYYSAADEGIATSYYAQYQAAGVFGNKLPGYPEYFLNINSPATVSITEAMINQQCAAKGFDAVETDLDETYSGVDGSTGFSLSEADEVAYMTTLANYMHRDGLAWIIKNPDDTGDNYAATMEPLADGVLTEQCNQYGTCSALSSYVGHKAVFNAEYNIPTSQFCANDDSLGINGVYFPVDLNGPRSPCR